MASYKIYFLNFCYQNCSFSARNDVIALQNATEKGRFTEKWIFGEKIGPNQDG